jgi:hypothetical protein
MMARIPRRQKDVSLKNIDNNRISLLQTPHTRDAHGTRRDEGHFATETSCARFWLFHGRSIA